MRIIKRFHKRPEMHREPHGHEYMKDLVRLSPNIKPPRSPRLRHSYLPRNISHNNAFTSAFFSKHSTYRIYCDSSQIYHDSESIPQCSCLIIHLAIPVQEAGVNNWVKGGRCHEREQEAAQRAPRRLSEAAYEDDEYCCYELGDEVKLTDEC